MINEGITEILFTVDDSSRPEREFLSLPNGKQLITVKLKTPWIPEIFLECYCVERKKPIRHEITKL